MSCSFFYMVLYVWLMLENFWKMIEWLLNKFSNKVFVIFDCFVVGIFNFYDNIYYVSFIYICFVFGCVMCLLKWV